jgi:hypothetical protein
MGPLVEQEAEVAAAAMLDRERHDVEVAGALDRARLELDVVDGDRDLVAAQDDAHEVADAIQRRAAAVDRDAIDRLPARERADQPAEPEDVVQVAVREQHRVEPLEAQPAAQDLTLRALAAVDQPALVAIHDDDGRQPAPHAGGRGGGAQECDLEHGLTALSDGADRWPVRPRRRARW